MSLAAPATDLRPRLLFVQPSLRPPGGGNGVGAWILQALRDDYALDVLTWNGIDIVALNRYFGTDLRPEDVQATAMSGPLRMIDRLPTPSALLKSSILLRRAHQVAGRYETVVSANNEADFGRPGIQYVHYPWSYRPRPEVDLRWYHQPMFLRGYYAITDRISPFDLARVKDNLTWVNSEWTGDLVRRLYPGIETRVLHPPVAGRFPAVDWNEREDGVVVLGRISSEKRVDLAIEIVRRVRERGYPLRLHVIGSPDHNATFRKVRSLVRRHSDWITLHQDISRQELVALLSRQRYGVHAMKEEHYGMAVAEMVVAGLVPFVPDGGGQREIVDRLPDLLWRTPEEAVERFVAVLSDPGRRDRVRAALAARAPALGTDQFVKRVREEVGAFLARRAS